MRLLAYLGARFIEPAEDGGPEIPFWMRFLDKKGRVRDGRVWEWVIAKGGDDGYVAGGTWGTSTRVLGDSIRPESLAKRTKLLKRAGLEDPRVGKSW